MQGPTQTCQTCGKTFAQGYTTSYDQVPPLLTWLESTVCYNCEQTALFSRLPAQAQQQVDDYIYEQHILQGMLLIKRSLVIGLTDSNFLFHWRYQKLKESNPARMRLSDEAYWDGFIS